MANVRARNLLRHRTSKIVACAALMGLAGALGAEAALAAPADSGWEKIELEKTRPTTPANRLTPRPSEEVAAAVAARIAGGRPAGNGEFPFTVFLDILDNDDVFLYRSRCTGAVISPEWVLTATHCIADNAGAISPNLDIWAVAGVTDLASEAEVPRPIDAPRGVDPTSANIHVVTELFRRNDYFVIPSGAQVNSGALVNDVALLRLNRPVSVRGIPLPPSASGAEVPGVTGTIAGWGNTNEIPDVSPSRMYVGTAPILSDADCGFYFPDYVPGLMNCTGPPPGTAPVDATTCKGDSGGPLLVPFGSDYLHAGITSFGPYPCQIQRIGAYARVSTYAPSIAQLLQDQQPGIGPAKATTGGVTQQHDDGLTVSGTVDPNGIATAYEVQWGTTPALGGGVVRGHADGFSAAQGRSYAGMGQSPTNVSARISGAPAGTEIFYRFSALSAAGTDSGSVASGQTSAPPPPPAPPAPAPTPPSLAATPTQGTPVCNSAPTRTPGQKGTIRLTPQALAIQQRIDAAALRRLNAANVWINQGIVPTDLCAGSLGPSAFQAGISWVGGAPVDTTPPSPRALRIIKKTKRAAKFTVSRRQVRINDTISRALFARAQATRDRIETLTGGNLAPGAKLTGRPLYPSLATTGPLPASQTAPATPLRIGPLPRAGKITVSTAQLKKTQQRSQEAIKIANRANDRITQGLTEAQFKAGSIGSSALTAT